MRSRVAAWRAAVSADVADAGLAAALLLLGGAQVAAQPPDSELALYLAFAPVIVLPVAWRRQAPLACATVAAVALIAQALVAEPAVSFGEFLAAIVLTYTLGAHARTIAAAVGGALMFAAVGVHTLQQSDDTWFEFLYGLVYFGGAFLLGRFVKLRAVRAAQRENHAVRDERARMAREMHDVISHTVGVMIVQAGAARASLPVDATASREALTEVESTGRQALTELRRLLTVLRSAEAADELEPQPGIASIGALVEQVRSTGLPVDLRLEGERRPLAPGLELSAYRIVQEALTNVLRHARAARAAVVIRFGSDALELDVVDDGDAPPGGATSGHGIVGMRERAALYGGSVDAGPDARGGFRVRARFPITTSSP